MSDLITVQDMCLWYGPTQALKNISIRIPEKSITALIGPSGCGKSTFLKTLDRMNDLIPTVKITGEVKYRGKNIFDPSVDVNELRRQIGMVFQKPNPFPMSIYDNIAYGPRNMGLDEAEIQRRVKEAAAFVGLSDELLEKIPADRREALKKVLEQDPRPSYQNSEERVYGLSFAGMEIKFQVKDQVLHVVGAERAGT